MKWKNGIYRLKYWMNSVNIPGCTRQTMVMVPLCKPNTEDVYKRQEVNNANHFIEGGNDLLAQSTGRFVRMEEGHPIGYLYGYKTDGVIQNQNDLQA